MQAVQPEREARSALPQEAARPKRRSAWERLAARGAAGAPSPWRSRRYASGFHASGRWRAMRPSAGRNGSRRRDSLSTWPPRRRSDWPARTLSPGDLLSRRYPRAACCRCSVLSPANKFVRPSLKLPTRTVADVRPLLSERPVSRAFRSVNSCPDLPFDHAGRSHRGTPRDADHSLGCAVADSF